MTNGLDRGMTLESLARRMSALVGMGLVLGMGCGKNEDAEHVAHEEQTQGDERPHEPNDGLAVEGLLGTLGRDEIQQGLEPRMDLFAGCFDQRSRAVSMIGGRVDLAFRVAIDGSVRIVHLRSSTVGDRETERCVLSVARSAKFPRPRGGEAEFAWPLELDPPGHVRPPLSWEPAQVESVVAKESADVLATCGAAGAKVTVYIGRGGKVITAGASIDEADSDAILDCVVERVSGWMLPDPGSYPAKVTFDLR